MVNVSFQLVPTILIPRNGGEYFPSGATNLQRPSKRRRAQLSVLNQPMAQDDSVDDTKNNTRPLNCIEVAMPESHYQLGLQKVGLLMDGKDCTTDTVRVNSLTYRDQCSDKVHSSAARFMMWVLPCGLSVTCAPLFLGRVPEKALVEHWGGSTCDLLCD